MDVDQLRTWLRHLGEIDVEVGHEWVRTHCPLAPWRHQRGTDRSPSFGLKIGPGESRAHCFACQFSGGQVALVLTLRDLIRDSGGVHNLDLAAAMRMAVEADEAPVELALRWDEAARATQLHPFPEAWLETFGRAYADGWVHSYLERRRVPLAVARFLDLRWSNREGRVCFPIRDWDGILMGLHGRAIDDEVMPPYRMFLCEGHNNPIVWLGEAWVDATKPVLLVESVFDLASAYRVYRNVMCPLSASLSVSKIERVARLDHVVTLFDPDAAGDIARRKVSQVLGRDCVVETLVPSGDRDPGAMTVGELIQILDPVVDLDSALT